MDPANPMQALGYAKYKQRKKAKVNDINIGVCGQVKAGKSKLVNSLRKVKEGDATFAKEGEAETTTEPTMYAWTASTGDNVFLWDIPGAGTTKVSAETYFESNRLFRFDLLLLLILDDLRESDIRFAEKAFQYGVPFAFVRSRCDRDLYRLADDEGVDVDLHILKTYKSSLLSRSFSNEQHLERKQHLEKFRKIKNEFTETLKQHIMDELKPYSSLAYATCFCISSRYLQDSYKYAVFELEEERFENYILQKLAEAIAAEASERLVKAIRTYNAENIDQLSFKINDQFVLIKKDVSGWWQGKIGEKIGTFPGNFVRQIRPMVRAIFTYNASYDDEISFNVGDQIELISKETSDPGWWRGKIGNRQGIFPDNFVAEI